MMWTLQKQVVEMPYASKISRHLSIAKIECLSSSASSSELERISLEIYWIALPKYIWMVFEGIELYHNLALSFKEKGKRIIIIPF